MTDHGMRDLWRGYHHETRRRNCVRTRDAAPEAAADHDRDRPEADDEDEADADAADETCPFGRAWCDPSADLSTGGGFPCLSCWLRADRDDAGPHPDVAAVADGQGQEQQDDHRGP